MYVCMLGIMLIIIGISQAAPTGTAFTYQGRLTEGGNPGNTPYDFRFRLYDALAGGSQVNSTLTKLNVPVNDGYFAVELDFSSVFLGDATWLEIDVAPQGSGTYTTLTPRQELTPTPYAINADTLDGLDADDFFDADSDHGRLGVAATLYEGTNSLSSKYVNETGDVMESSTAGPVLTVNNTGSGAGMSVTTDGAETMAIYGRSNNSGNYCNYGGYFMSDGNYGKALYGTTSGEYGTAVHGYASDSGAYTTYGGYFKAQSTLGRGVYAEASGTDGRGVYAKATNTASNTNFGGYFQCDGQSGTAVYGLATGDQGHAVEGLADDTGSLLNVGGYFQARGQYGWGVYGNATGSNGTGVYGKVSGSSGIAGRFQVDNSSSSLTVALAAESNGPGHTLEAVCTKAGSVPRVVNFERTEIVAYGNDMLQIKIADSSDDGCQFIECERGGDVKFRVNGDGNVTADGIFTPGGADFAEMIKVSDAATAAEPGDLMVIDPQNNRSVAKSAKPRSTLVAGVFSTKPGFLGSKQSWDKPVSTQTESDSPYSTDENGAYSISEYSQHYNEIPLALVGIVPCKVSAENGPVLPGDLLVTSSTPGHAMRDNNPKPGTIVGKALGSLSAGTGVIEILVTLQ